MLQKASLFKKGQAMTVQEAIDKTDQIKPNAYTIEDKIGWLSNLDGQVYEEVIKRHDNYVETEDNRFKGYTVENVDNDLIIPFPYENVYIDWLTAQIDLTNADIGRYNNSITSFYTEYNNFTNWYRREHMPTQKHGWRL